MSSNESAAVELLGDIDEKVKDIEDTKLGRWARFKRRYLNWKGVAIWTASGNFTLGQVFVGKKVIAWFVTTCPKTAAFFVKVWLVIVAATTAVKDVVVHVQ